MIDTDAFYRKSCERGFVQLQAIARNIAWTTATGWGELEITINLSKPEKDPEAIAAAALADAGSQPGEAPASGCTIVDGNPAIRVGPCQLCVTDQDVETGYAKRITLGGEPWGLWYSPYAYYNEHCIAMCWEHRPMHVDRAAFECLFDFADQFPHYFIGSNADLPIVGGSILSHDHFQGGGHVFPMHQAPVDGGFELPAFPDVKAGVVRWPLSVIRLEGEDRVQLVDAAAHILGVWRGYSDPAAGVLAETGGEPHNTITPMLRRVDAAAGRADDVAADKGAAGVANGGWGVAAGVSSVPRYQFDLALRCNITSPAHPLGVFHPHEHLHHIKRENIGLIEVMGLAILPARVRDVMHERGLSRDDVGKLFAQVLECAGVFKWDGPGRAAQARFIDAL